jgi:hypothetical protein
MPSEKYLTNEMLITPKILVDWVSNYLTMLCPIEGARGSVAG